MPDMDERLRDRLRLSMDLAPVTDYGREYLSEHAEEPRPFRLISYRHVSPRVPVYLVYYTSGPTSMATMPLSAVPQAIIC